MKYYLSIGEVIVQVNCPDNLYLIDDWKIFFEDFLGKFLIDSSEKYDVEVILTGLKTKGLKTLPSGDLFYPKICDKKMEFDNLIHPSLFLYYLEKLVKPFLYKRDSVFLHASAFLKDNKAFLVTGDSESGKSTLLANVCGKYKALADDSILLKLTDRGILVYPSPMNMKIKVDVENKDYLLGGVLTIDKKGNFGVKKMKELEAMCLIVDQLRLKVNKKKVAVLSLKIAKELSKNLKIISYVNRRDRVLDIIGEL